MTTYSLGWPLYLAGLCLSAAAAFFALRLIRHTGKRKAGPYLFIASLLLAAVMAYELLLRLGIFPQGVPGHRVLADLLPIATSVLLLAGMISIRAVLMEHKRTEAGTGEQVEGSSNASQAVAKTAVTKLASGNAVMATAGEGSAASVPAYQEQERRRGVRVHQEWQAAFDAVTIPMVLYDPAFKVIHANRAYIERAGLTLKDIIGKPYFDIYPKLGRPIVDTPQNLKQGIAGSELRLATGEIVISRNFPIYNEANEYHHSLHILEDVTGIRQAEKSVRRTQLSLNVVTACVREMASAKDEQHMLQSICRIVVRGGGYRLAWVGFVEGSEGRTARLVASHGYKKDLEPVPDASWPDADFDKSPMGIAIRTGKTVLCQDFMHDPQFGVFHGDALKHHLAAVVALPLYSGQRIVGGLVLWSDQAFAFSDEEVAVLEGLSASIDLGISAFRIREEHATDMQNKTQHLDNVRDKLEKIIEAMGEAIEQRQTYAVGHQRRVGEICLAIAQEMGLPDDRAYGVRLAGMVHDVGAIQIPEGLLCKTGKLTEDDRRQIESHTQAGHDILSGLDLPWPLAQAVLQHHERLDGSGYPNGLTGGKILLEAKIIAVADTIEAMAYGQRTDHPRLGVPAALAEIAKHKGTLYDEDVVDATLRLYWEKGYELT